MHVLPERFTEAWVNRPHRVFGFRLQPYCLWHRFGLETIESPFLAPQGEPTLSDLDIAVRICRSRYPHRGSASFARLVGVSPGKSLGYWRGLRFALFARFSDPRAEGAKFIEYIRDFQSPPDFWQSPGQSHPETNGAPPETLSVATQLIHGGFDEESAWSMPVGQAFWYAATLARLAGVKIMFVSESPKLFEGLARLIALRDSGKLRFESKGIVYTP